MTGANVAARFVVLYTRPEDADGFLREYLADHVPITQTWPGLTSGTTTVLDSTPRGGEPGYWLMFVGTWDTDEAMQAAMRDPSMTEAGRHAIDLTRRYGNRAEMMLGADA